MCFLFCVRVCVCACACVQVSLQELLLSFYHEGSGMIDLSLSYGGKHVYLLRHFTSPLFAISIDVDFPWVNYIHFKQLKSQLKVRRGDTNVYKKH